MMTAALCPFSPLPSVKWQNGRALTSSLDHYRCPIKLTLPAFWEGQLLGPLCKCYLLVWFMVCMYMFFFLTDFISWVFPWVGKTRKKFLVFKNRVKQHHEKEGSKQKNFAEQNPCCGNQVCSMTPGYSHAGSPHHQPCYYSPGGLGHMPLECKNPLAILMCYSGLCPLGRITEPPCVITSNHKFFSIASLLLFYKWILV